MIGEAEKVVFPVGIVEVERFKHITEYNQSLTDFSRSLGALRPQKVGKDTMHLPARAAADAIRLKQETPINKRHTSRNVGDPFGESGHQLVRQWSRGKPPKMTGETLLVLIQ
jgi:hypothetical protein